MSDLRIYSQRDSRRVVMATPYPCSVWDKTWSFSQDEFGEEIYLMLGPYVSCSQWGIRASLIDIMGLTPRQQTEAVLRTLGRWPNEWEGA